MPALSPFFVCFVALREEMGNINQRLKEAEATYANGTFDSKRARHSYEIRRRAAPRIDLTFVVLEEMGNIGTAATVSAVLNQLQPQAAFILGIAGTLDLQQAKLGDVVVSSSAKFIGPNKVSAIDADRVAFAPLNGITESELNQTSESASMVDARRTASPEPQALEISSPPATLNPMKRIGPGSWLRFRRHAVEIVESKTVIAGFRNSQSDGAPVPLKAVDEAVIAAEGLAEYRNTEPKIRNGSILGSEWVVDSGEFNEFLLHRDQTDADDYVTRCGDNFDRSQQLWYNDPIACLDMESYGFFRAIREFHTSGGGSLMHGFSIRGISDPCRDKRRVEQESRRAIRRIAVDNAVETLIDFIFFFADLDVGRRR